MCAGSTSRSRTALSRVPLGSQHPDFELEGSARSIVQFEGVLPKAAPCVAYATVDLDGQVGIVVDVSPEVYKLVRLVVHLARCLQVTYQTTREKHSSSCDCTEVRTHVPTSKDFEVVNGTTGATGDVCSRILYNIYIGI